MRQLPGGIITLLFTDIEGSTRLLQQLGSRYGEVLNECRTLLRAAFAQWHGYEVDTQGDAFFVVFARVADAVSAAVTLQRTLATHCWPDDVTVRVRVGLHTGEPEATEEGYVGLDVHRASRIMNAGHGGQVLLSQSTRDLTALEWLLEQVPTDKKANEQALQFCVALISFWETRGYFREGAAFLERALATAEGTNIPLRAEALYMAGFLALIMDETQRAQALLHESQLLFRESGDKAGMANILRLQGNLAFVKNNYRLARRLLEEALITYQEVGNERGVVRARQDLTSIAISQCNFARARSFMEENLAQYRAWGEQYHAAYPLYHLARILFLSRDDIQQAQSLAEESLTSFQQVRNGRLAAYTLSLLAQIHLAQSNSAIARAQLDEAMKIFKKVGDRFGITLALLVAGQVAVAQGDMATALTAYRECWELSQTIGALELSAGCLEGTGEMLMAQGEVRSAVALWGKAAIIRADLVAPMPSVERVRYAQSVATAREQLGSEEFKVAWLEGRQQKSLVGFIV